MISADTTYGITLLLTTTEKINFVHPYQERYVVEPKAQQINDLFVGDVLTPATSFTFVGFNWSLYLRGLLLVFGLFYVLYRSRTGRPWLYFAPKPATQRRSFWRFAFYWAKNNLLVRAFFYLAIMIIFGILRTRYTQVQSDMVAGCYYIPFTDQGYFEWAWGYLLCFYPLLAILVIKALAQRQMLSNVNIPVSVWWIVAPLAAGPLLMVISRRLYCEDCLTLKYLMFGTIKTSDTLHMIGLVIYFLCLGLIQWLALRKKLPLSFGWTIMPLVNAMFIVLEKSIYRYLYIFYLSGPTLPEDLDRMRFIVVFLPVLMIVPAIIISEIIPALYISCLIHRRNAS